MWKYIHKSRNREIFKLFIYFKCGLNIKCVHFIYVLMKCICLSSSFLDLYIY